MARDFFTVFVLSVLSLSTKSACETISTPTTVLPHPSFNTSIIDNNHTEDLVTSLASDDENIPGIITNEIASWVAPSQFTHWFPYYLTGHDYEGAPVFVVEMGNFKPQAAIRETVGGREKAKEIASKYFDQAIYKIHRAGLSNQTGVGLIVYFAGFNLPVFFE